MQKPPHKCLKVVTRASQQFGIDETWGGLHLVMALGMSVLISNAFVPSAIAQTTTQEAGKTGIEMIPTDLPAHASSVPEDNGPVSLLPGTIPAEAVIEQDIEIPSLSDQYQRTINGQPPIRPVRKQVVPQTAVTQDPVPASSSIAPQPVATPKRHAVSQPVSSTPVETAAPISNGGRHLIQLGAFRDTFTAETYWAGFSIRYPELTKSHDKQIVPADLGSQGIYHRLQLIGFADTESAQKQCRQLKADGTDCFATHR